MKPDEVPDEYTVQEGEIYVRTVVRVEDGQQVREDTRVRLYVLDDILSGADKFSLLAIPIDSRGEYVPSSRGIWISKENFPIQHFPDSLGIELIRYKREETL